MCRGVGHAAGAARGTESAPFTRKCDEPLPAAVLAADAQEASTEEAAVEEGAELVQGDARDHPALIAGKGEKGLEALLHDSIENSVFGLAPLVLQRMGQIATDEGVIQHEQELVRVACLR